MENCVRKLAILMNPGAEFVVGGGVGLRSARRRARYSQSPCCLQMNAPNFVRLIRADELLPKAIEPSGMQELDDATEPVAYASGQAYRQRPPPFLTIHFLTDYKEQRFDGMVQLVSLWPNSPKRGTISHGPAVE
jgi:hypothetical protein